MLNRVLALTTAATLLVSAAYAAPGKEKAKTAPKSKTTTQKVVTLNTCPVTGEAVKGAAGGSEMYAGYKVTFCCAGCKPEFDKLSKADKDKKVKEIAAKEVKTGKKG